MTTMTATEADVRDMVLQVGTSIARRVVDAAKAASLSNATDQEEFDVAGVKWTVYVIYDRDRDAVLINGSMKNEVQLPEGMPPFIAQMVQGMAEQENDEPKFSYAVPTAWLPDAGI